MTPPCKLLLDALQALKGRRSKYFQGMRPDLEDVADYYDRRGLKIPITVWSEAERKCGRALSRSDGKGLRVRAKAPE